MAPVVLGQDESLVRWDELTLVGADGFEAAQLAADVFIVFLNKKVYKLCKLIVEWLAAAKETVSWAHTR